MIGQPLLGLERVLTMEVDLERDIATADDYGAEIAKDWQPLATVACFLWWGNGAAATRLGQPQQRPEQTVDLSVGGIVLPGALDLTDRDQIIQVRNQAGDVVAGKLFILAVAPFEGLTEISFRRMD